MDPPLSQEDQLIVDSSERDKMLPYIRVSGS